MTKRRLTNIVVALVVSCAVAGCAADETTCEDRTCVAPPANEGSGGRDGAASDGGASGSEASGREVSGSGGGGGQTTHEVPAGCTPWDNAPGVAVPESCGMFVANSGDEGHGSKSSPFGNVTQALEAAQAGDVFYLCSHVFEENVTVPAGVTLYGGLACGAGWSFTDGDKTLLIGEPNAPAIRFAAGAQPSTIYDFVLVAPDATELGTSSVVALIEGGAVHFERVDVTAGRGANGVPGATPTTDIGPSDPSHASIRGGAPCTGGMGCASPLTCTDIDVNFHAGSATSNPWCATAVGGAGGRGQVATQGIAASSGGSGSGQGGYGGSVTAFATSCTNGKGQRGAHGVAGQPGLGATGLGALTVDGWLGTLGMAAARGSVGGGGGGGGGRSAPQCGGGGGGGGAGGCGGFGGEGGAAAGGSFAVILLEGTLTTVAGSLTTGDGGIGGAGGPGQVGGVGGMGSLGGAGGSGGSCPGAFGGDGGTGGKGGGGLGGHAVSVAHSPTAAVQIGPDTIVTYGLGGRGGAGRGIFGDGAMGEVAQVLVLSRL